MQKKLLEMPRCSMHICFIEIQSGSPTATRKEKIMAKATQDFTAVVNRKSMAERLRSSGGDARFVSTFLRHRCHRFSLRHCDCLRLRIRAPLHCAGGFVPRRNTCRSSVAMLIVTCPLVRPFCEHAHACTFDLRDPLSYVNAIKQLASIKHNRYSASAVTS